MRVNVYAEELTPRIEVIEKKVKGRDGQERTFTGLRFYLELPVTTWVTAAGQPYARQDKGPFLHNGDAADDDSSAVTFWGKRELRRLLVKALAKLDEHFERETEQQPS